MKKIMPLFITLAFLLAMGCSSVPEGFDSAEKAAYESKAKADAADAQTVLPMEYETAESVLKAAETKKEAKELDDSMKLFKEADRKYAALATKVQKKNDLDAYMKDTTPYINGVESKIDKADKKK